jgi:hypothetical protein
MFFVSRRSVEEAIGKRQMVSSPSEDEFHMGSHTLGVWQQRPEHRSIRRDARNRKKYKLRIETFLIFRICGSFFQNARNLRAHLYCGATRPDE